MHGRINRGDAVPVLMLLVAIFLILLVLVQRGRGGGLAGAFGGMGGQSAFGTKAGDLFTRITIGVAAVLDPAVHALPSSTSAAARQFDSELGRRRPPLASPAGAVDRRRPTSPARERPATGRRRTPASRPAGRRATGSSPRASTATGAARARTGLATRRASHARSSRRRQNDATCLERELSTLAC